MQSTTIVKIKNSFEQGKDILDELQKIEGFEKY